MNPKHLDQFLPLFQVGRPELWRLAYPRRIIPPNGYINPKYYALSVCSVVEIGNNPQLNKQPHVTLMLAEVLLVKHRMPTYFVASEWAQAVAATEPPANMTMLDIHFPMEAMLLVMPDGFTESYCGARCPFIVVGRVGAGEWPKDHPDYLNTWRRLRYVSSVHVNKDKLIIHYPVYFGTLPPIDYTGAYSLEAAISEIKDAEFCDAMEYEESLTVPCVFDEAGQMPTKEKEMEINRKMNALAVKLLLAMSAQPQDIELLPQLLRPEKTGRGGVIAQDALWHANMIGRSYRIVRPPGDAQGSHASPRMHWRKGHFKGQRYGLARAKCKTIWIHPTLVNAGDGDE